MNKFVFFVCHYEKVIVICFLGFGKTTLPITLNIVNEMNLSISLTNKKVININIHSLIYYCQKNIKRLSISISFIKKIETKIFIVPTQIIFKSIIFFRFITKLPNYQMTKLPVSVCLRLGLHPLGSVGVGVRDLLGHVLIGLAQECRDLEEEDADDVLEGEGAVVSVRVDESLVVVVVGGENGVVGAMFRALSLQDLLQFVGQDLAPCQEHVGGCQLEYLEYKGALFQRTNQNRCF